MGLALIYPALSFLVPLLIGAALVVASGGRSGTRTPMPPSLVFALSLSLTSLVVLVVAVGITVGSAVHLVGHSTATGSSSIFGSRQSAVVSSSGSVDSSSGAFRTVPARPVASDFGSDDNRNRSIATAAIAGFFALAALVGYLLAWRRALAMLVPDAGGADGRDEHDASTRPPPVGYAYLVAGLAGASLLVLVPLVAAGVFEALAPGVTGSSVAAGSRQTLTFGVVAGISAMILVSHLRLAGDLQAQTVPAPPTPLVELQ